MRLSFVTTTLSTLSNKKMSLITIDEFDAFIEENPEMEQCYSLSSYDEDESDMDDPFLATLAWMDGN